MMNIEKLVHWLLDHRRFVFAMFAIMAIVGMFSSFLSHNAFVFVEANGIDKNSEIITYGSSDAENAKIGGSGLMLISRSVKSLLVTNGDYIKTQTKIDIPWYGYLHKKIQLAQDNNADKIAYKSTVGYTCATYSQSLDKLLYFACHNPKTLLRYDTPTDRGWSTKKIADIYYSGGEAKPYMGGVIGITHVEATDAVAHGDIVHTTETGKPIAYEAPEEMEEASISRSKIFTDTANLENNRFIVVDITGDIYLASPQQGSTINYEKIPAPEKYDSTYNETLCAIDNESFYCYRGKGAIGDAPHDETLKNVSDYELINGSFTSSDTSTIKIDGADGVLNIDNIYVSEGEVYVKLYKKLFRLDLKDNIYVMNELLQNVDSASSNQNLYVVQNGGVYKWNKPSSEFQQVFYSENVIPKKVYAVSDKVFVIGNIKGNDKITYAYALNDEPNLSPGKRLIDLLPTASGVITGTTGNDLIEDRLLLTLPVITTKATRGQAGINTGEMEARKSDALNALGGQDIPINEDNIQFVY